VQRERQEWRRHIRVRDGGVGLPRTPALGNDCNFTVRYASASPRNPYNYDSHGLLRDVGGLQYGRAPGPMRRTVQLGSPPASNIRGAVLSDRRQTQSSIASSPPLRVPPTHRSLELFVSQILVGTASYRRRPPQRRINIALLRCGSVLR